MKKIIAILLLCIYLFGATDAYQLLKIPMLVSHYREHRMFNSSITLTQFFKLHYAGKIKIDSDFQDDMRLPFKTHETECCLTIATIVPPQIQILQQFSETISKEYTVLNDKMPPSLPVHAIFQPPRI